MFKENKYTKYYTLITDRARGRTLDTYTERHHIIPESLGGPDTKENLVDLSAREHFICHWLLIKMTEGEARSKMLYALNGMKAENRYQKRYSSAITARVYERYRIEHAKNHSERMKGKPAWNKGVPQTEGHKEKNRQAALSRAPKSEETIEKWKKSRAGYKHTETTKLKQSLASKGKLKGPMSEEEKLKRSAKQKGVAKKEGHAANVRAAVLGNVSINKDGFEKKVKRDTLDTWLAEGWQLGGRKRK
jgi:hypothetical protein